MPIEFHEETLYKVVFIGPRGVPARVLEAARERWEVESWFRQDGLGELGEPVIDLATCQVPFPEGYRVYLFGHGIDADDFFTLGPETRTAILRGADRVVVTVVEGSSTSLFVEGVNLAYPDGARPALEIAVVVGSDHGVVPAEVRVTVLGDDPYTWLEAMVDRVIGVGA